MAEEMADTNRNIPTTSAFIFLGALGYCLFSKPAVSSGAPTCHTASGHRLAWVMPLFLVGKAGFEARKLSVEGLSPFYRSAEVHTMVPPHRMDQTQTIRFYSPLSIMPIFECGMGGALRTPVALRTRCDPTTERREGYSMVKAQRAACFMTIVPVRDCAYSSLWTSTLPSEPSKEVPVPPSPVKKRREQHRDHITFHKSHFFAPKSHTYPPVPLVKAKCFPSSHVARIKRLLGLKSHAIINRLHFHSVEVRLPPLQ